MPPSRPSRDDLIAEVTDLIFSRLTPAVSQDQAVGAAEQVVDIVCQPAVRAALREAAAVARKRYPRGDAHTYASENADRYRALEDASAEIASAIEALATCGDV